MAWDDVAPTKDELAATSAHAWDSTPPSKDELAAHASAESTPSSWLDKKILGGTPRGYIQSTLDTLPLAGTVVGGIAGTPADVVSGPGGTLLGAGVGGAAGQTLKEAGERFILGKDKPNAEVLKNVAMALPEGAANEAGGQLVGKGIGAAAESKAGKYVAGKVGDFGKWLANNSSNVSKSDMETYLKDPAKVLSIFKEAGGDEQEMADSARKSINEKLQATKSDLNNKISTALKNSPKEKTIDVTPIIEKLESHKASIDPSLNPEGIKDIDGLISRIKGTAFQPKEPVLAYDAVNEMNARVKGVPYDQRVTELSSGDIKDSLKHKVSSVPVITTGAKSGEAIFPEATTDKTGKWIDRIPEDRIIELPTGGGGTQYMANAQKLHDINRFLQKQASPAYGSTPIGFQVGDEAANAAKGAASIGRQILGKVTPEVAEANGVLSRLHGIEDVMNKNMLAEGKPANSLYTAANGDSPSNAKALRQLGEITGTDIVGDAKNLSAARTFGNPSMTPLDKTGKSVARMGAAGILGGTAGYLAGGDEKSAVIGGLAAEGLTSPAMIKLAMDSGMGTKAIAQKLATQAPAVMGKGAIGWANNGFSKLFQHASDEDRKALIDNQDALMESKKGKDLLVSASSLKPGSKQMDKVLEQIKEESK